MRNLNFFALTGLLALLSACSSLVPATVTRAPSFPFEKDKGILLMATRQNGRIAQSLKDAGLKIVVKRSESEYALQVKVGSSRATSECGSINNVVYLLNVEGERIVVIKGRGKTGTCTPNIFDDMSRKLAEQGA